MNTQSATEQFLNWLESPKTWHEWVTLAFGGSAVVQVLAADMGAVWWLRATIMLVFIGSCLVIAYLDSIKLSQRLPLPVVILLGIYVIWAIVKIILMSIDCYQGIPEHYFYCDL